MIGSAASAVDISRDIAGVAKEVHIACRSVADETVEKHPGYDNLWLHSMVKQLTHGKELGGYDEQLVKIFFQFCLSFYII